MFAVWSNQFEPEISAKRTVGCSRQKNEIESSQNQKMSERDNGKTNAPI